MFKHRYLKNRKYFLELLLHFWNREKILRIVKKKDQIHSLYN